LWTIGAAAPPVAPRLPVGVAACDRVAVPRIRSRPTPAPVVVGSAPVAALARAIVARATRLAAPIRRGARAWLAATAVRLALETLPPARGVPGLPLLFDALARIAVVAARAPALIAARFGSPLLAGRLLG
jgi:hypothetical protein